MSYQEAVNVLVCVDYDGGLPQEAARAEQARMRIQAQRRLRPEGSGPKRSLQSLAKEFDLPAVTAVDHDYGWNPEQENEQ